MSKPRGEGDWRQVSTWVTAELKAALALEAEASGKSEREVVVEALEARLGVAAPEQSHPQAP